MLNLEGCFETRFYLCSVSLLHGLLWEVVQRATSISHAAQLLPVTTVVILSSPVPVDKATVSSAVEFCHCLSCSCDLDLPF